MNQTTTDIINAAIADGAKVGVDITGELFFGGGEAAMEKHGASVKNLPPSEVGLFALVALARRLAHDSALDNRHPEVVQAVADAVAAGFKDAAKDAANPDRDTP